MNAEELDKFKVLINRLSEIDKSKKAEITPHLRELFNSAMEALYIGAGAGSFYSQMHTNFTKFDRFGVRFVPERVVKNGYVFITRPEINVESANVRLNRTFGLLDTFDVNSLQFMIRCLLSTRFTESNMALASSSPWVDVRNPFLQIVSNNLVSISGFPTYQLDSYQEEGGYYGEVQVFPTGSVSFKSPYDIQLSLLDPYGGPLFALFYMWELYIDLVARGELLAYPDQITDQVINYSSSIYRFQMDPSLQYIENWGKATGCWPWTHPGASIFDFSTSDSTSEATRTLSITFKCGSGSTDLNDPIVIQEFNTLVERFYPPLIAIRKGEPSNLIRCGMTASENYLGIPYITATANGPRLDVYRDPNEGATKLTQTIIQAQQSARKVSTSYDQLYLRTIRDYYNNSNRRTDSEISYI